MRCEPGSHYLATLYPLQAICPLSPWLPAPHKRMAPSQYGHKITACTTGPQLFPLLVVEKTEAHEWERS